MSARTCLEVCSRPAFASGCLPVTTNMMSADPLDILLRHDAWATREVLRACSGLTDEQCLNMLRHLGAPGISDRLPEIDPLDWQLQAEA
jgi:hypothetical protein